MVTGENPIEYMDEVFRLNGGKKSWLESYGTEDEVLERCRKFLAERGYQVVDLHE